MPRMRSCLIAGVLLLCGSPIEVWSQEEGAAHRWIEPIGDFRIRLENDWDSRQGDGTQRDDRLRLRIRLRLGVDLSFSDQWSARVQLRSGQHKSQQSPHITIYDFDGGDTGPYQFDFDYWYLSYKKGGFEAWAGRNELSFWHQDDLFLISHGCGGGVRQSGGPRGSGGRAAADREQHARLRLAQSAVPAPLSCFWPLLAVGGGLQPQSQGLQRGPGREFQQIPPGSSRWLGSGAARPLLAQCPSDAISLRSQEAT